MLDFQDLTLEHFKTLPLVIEGESKEVRYLGKGLVVIRFKPTIYSFTENRCAVVPGSHIPRMLASKVFVEILAKAGIRHAYQEFSKEFILASLIMPHRVEFEKYKTPIFRPADLTQRSIEELPRAPPIEVIAKRYLTGTTKHGCIGMVGSSVRASHKFYADMKLEADGALPEMLIRFDWRNPLTQPGRGQQMANLLGLEVGDVQQRVVAYGDRVADTVLPEQIADWYIDVPKSRRTAFMAAITLETFLASRNIVFYDLCMFLDESGEIVYGEISPDCGRFRHLDHGSLDKDVWRSGGSSHDVINKWNLLTNLIGVQ